MQLLERQTRGSPLLGRFGRRFAWAVCRHSCRRREYPLLRLLAEELELWGARAPIRVAHEHLLQDEVELARAPGGDGIIPRLELSLDEHDGIPSSRRLLQ